MFQETFFSKLLSVFSNPPNPAGRNGGHDLTDHREPRKHHYYFAHEYLPEMAAADARSLIARLRERSANDYLTFLWTSAGHDITAAGGAILPADGLHCFAVELADNWFGVLVQFPRPTRVLEAYFAAIVLEARRPLATDHRYFTLELGENIIDGSMRTVMCEWDEERHINYGDGPEPDSQKFCQRLGQLLSHETPTD